MRSTFLSFVSSTADLLFPAQCAGCGHWDTVLCDQCWLLADRDPTLGAIDDSRGIPQVPLWSLGSYGGSLRTIIVAAKHRPGVDLEDFMFQAGCCLGEVASYALEGTDVPAWVVPAPSSWRRRWDGREVTIHVAHGVAAGIKESLPGRPVRVVETFRLRPGSGSQSNRGKDARRHARRGALRIVRRPPVGTAVILVDDVMATGATLHEMAEQLGTNVQAAVVLARA